MPELHTRKSQVGKSPTPSGYQRQSTSPNLGSKPTKALFGKSKSPNEPGIVRRSAYLKMNTLTQSNQDYSEFDPDKSADSLRRKKSPNEPDLVRKSMKVPSALSMTKFPFHSQRTGKQMSQSGMHNAPLKEKSHTPRLVTLDIGKKDEPEKT